MDEQQNIPMNDAVPEASEAPATEPLDELSAAKALAAENLAGWKRATADYANLKKEMERSTADLAKYAVAGFIGKLLPVVDSFRKATEQKPIGAGEPLDEQRIGQWIDGIGHIRSQLDNLLAGAGVTAIDKSDVPFDATRHDAMMMQKADGVAAGTVIKVLDPGYMVHDRVIRPAKVIVAE
jgi:molecular chaperone GrpE